MASPPITSFLYFIMLMITSNLVESNVITGNLDEWNPSCGPEYPWYGVPIHPKDVDMLQFALNLEHLEAEYFLFGSLGYGLDKICPELVMGGPPPIGAMKANLDNLTRRIITEFGYQEVGHLRAIKSNVGGFPRPLLDLSKYNFARLFDEAFGYNLDPPFDPYANSINYMLSCYVLPYVGVNGYVGMNPFLIGYKSKRLQAGLLGVESAQDAVIRMYLYERGKEIVHPYNHTVKDALTQFEMALTLDPNPIEAQAALYNKACCHAYKGEEKKAAECLRTALREYGLKFGTILNDPDLASFRASKEFKELQEEARLGGEDVGSSFRRDLKLISEVQAPFRGVRRFFYIAFSAAAGISTFFTIPRLIRAIQGGDGAPDIWETAGNGAVNVGGLVILVALLIWDNKKEEEQLAQISRDETLSRLPLRLSTNRIVELVQLRDTARPVILAGKKETVLLAIQKAERFRTELLKRGVLLVPIIWGEAKKPQVERKGFGGSAKATTSLPSIGEDFDTRAQSITAKSRLKAEVRFKAEIVSSPEWESWIRDQQKSEGVTPGEDVYIILRLDGRVRRSGKGMPDWQQIVSELPPMEALLSKLER